MANVVARLLIATLVALTVTGSPAWSQAPTAEIVAERRVKAAYLHRFAGYVEWPDGAFAKPDSPLVIGIWGNDELAEDLARLVASRTVDGRRIEVRRVKDNEPPGALHMLFVSRERAGRLGESVGAHLSRGTLVVTESNGALRQGSVINFVMSEGQIRFELSLDAAEKNGLKLSSRLVAVAQNASGRIR